MKNFIVFWGDSYYPLGGFKDKHISFAFLEEAKAFADGLVTDGSLVWAHVVDFRMNEIVYIKET